MSSQIVYSRALHVGNVAYCAAVIGTVTSHTAVYLVHQECIVQRSWVHASVWSYSPVVVLKCRRYRLKSLNCKL